MKNAAGWAVELLGSTIDIDHLRTRLPPPFDPQIESFRNGQRDALILRSSTFAKLRHPRAVKLEAERLLSLLHGEALLTDPQAEKITPGGVLQFDTAGKHCHAYEIFEPARFTVRGGHIATMNSSGENPNELTSAQRRIQAAATQDLIADMLFQLSRCNDWPDLYILMELVREKLGGSKGVRRHLGEEFPEWKRAFETANCARHAPIARKSRMPEPPSEWKEAKALVVSTIDGII